MTGGSYCYHLLEFAMSRLEAKHRHSFWHASGFDTSIHILINCPARDESTVHSGSALAMRVILDGGRQHAIPFVEVFSNIRTTACWAIAYWQNIMPPARFRYWLKSWFLRSPIVSLRPGDGDYASGEHRELY